MNKAIVVLVWDIEQSVVNVATGEVAIQFTNCRRPKGQVPELPEVEGFYPFTESVGRVSANMAYEVRFEDITEDFIIETANGKLYLTEGQSTDSGFYPTEDSREIEWGTALSGQLGTYAQETAVRLVKDGARY